MLLIYIELLCKVSSVARLISISQHLKACDQFTLVLLNIILRTSYLVIKFLQPQLASKIMWLEYILTTYIIVFQFWIVKQNVNTGKECCLLSVLSAVCGHTALFYEVANMEQWPTYWLYNQDTMWQTWPRSTFANWNKEPSQRLRSVSKLLIIQS